MFGVQETGDRRQETGDRRQETGDRRQGKRCKENCRRLQGGEQVRVESRSVAAATARAGVIWERGCFPPPLCLLTNHVPVSLLVHVALLRTLPGQFSGLHLVCLLYAAFQIINPSLDIGMDFAREYQMAKTLHGGS